MSRKKSEPALFPYSHLADVPLEALNDYLTDCASDELKRTEVVRGDLLLLNDVFMYMRYAFGYQDCYLSYINAFTMIAKHSPCPLGELPEKLNISRTTITRLVAYLGEGSTEGARPFPGLNYVMAMEDPLDTRRKLVSLTVAGELVAHNVSRLMQGKVTFEDLKIEQAEHALTASKRPPK